MEQCKVSGTNNLGNLKISLGFCGFLLLILLLSIIFITLAEDDMIVLIDNNEDTVGPENIDNCGNTTRIVKQSERLQNRLVLSGQLVKTYF